MQDYSQQILAALMEKLDIGRAFPIIFSLRVNDVNDFVDGVVRGLQQRMQAAMAEEGCEDDVFDENRMALMERMRRHGVNIPDDILSDICKEIIRTSRNVARLVAKTSDERWHLWYCKMQVDVSKDTVD